MSGPGTYDDPRVEALKRFLHTRVRTRSWKTGRAYTVDLRLDRFPGRNALTLKNPAEHGWPRSGRTARSEEEALAWVDLYVDRLGVDWFEGGRTPRTVARVAADYLEDLRQNAPPNTYVNRRSTVHRHVVPAFGEVILESLVAKTVKKWVDGLRKRDGTPMARSTLESILATLGELWRFEIDDRPTPWKGKVRLDLENGAVRRRREANDGERPESDRAYKVAELVRILRQALTIDTDLFNDPKRHRAVPDVAYVIAFLFYLGLRVEELTFLRRKDVYLERGLIFVPGTKTKGAQRWVPIQTSFRPWLEDVLERTPADPEAFLFHDPDLRGAAKADTLKERVTAVLEAAKQKRPGKATHIFRASHISIGLADGGVQKQDMDRFMGHTDGSIRDQHYFDAGVFAASLKEAHFNYLPELLDPTGREMLVLDRLRREKWVEAKAEKDRRSVGARGAHG